MIGEKINNYRIISVIGEGGMGSVYLGRHETLKREVAIKVLLPELARNLDLRERFINEATTLSNLNHPNIVTLYDFIDTGSNLYLIMEYVKGTELDEVINRMSAPLTLERCIKIFRPILSGFQYAHSKGIIHRDIKPSNIILTEDDVPKILDFGIAKLIHGNARLTKTGTKIGSVLYMSPEQILGREINTGSDIYSLGITLYEMLSGKAPFETQTGSEYEIQTKIVNDPLPPIRYINPELPSYIEHIISRATAKNPADRFRSCNEFDEAFSAASGQVQNVSGAGIYQKTVIQTPVSQEPKLQGSKSELKNNKTILYISIAAISVIAVLLFFIILKSGDSDSLNTDKKDKGTEIKKNISINEQEVMELLNLWQLYQNNLNISGYLSLYSGDFQGIKRTKSGKVSYLNYSEWADDRTKMYQSATSLYVGISELKVSELDNVNGTATAKFQQYYSSLKYTDEGMKIIKVRKDESRKLRIYYEEMVYSVESIGD